MNLLTSEQKRQGMTGWLLALLAATLFGHGKVVASATDPVLHRVHWADTQIDFAAIWNRGQEALASGIDVEMRGPGRELYRRIAPSVVLITNGESLGAGALLDQEGHILTNWHVIHGAPTVGVSFKPPRFEQVKEEDQILADVIRVNQVADLALIKLRQMPPNMTPIPLGKFDQIDIAMEVHAIGHPIGEVWTYTSGTISQVRPRYEWQTGPRERHQGDVIQTQTPINPGNSGGPLLNDEGELIGINSFTSSRAQGISYAVAISEIERFLDSSENVYLPGMGSRQKPGRPSPEESPGFSGKEQQPKESSPGSQLPEVGKVDRDGNGFPETEFVDDDNDGHVDRILVDRDENGTPDLEIRKDNIKGKNVMTWLFDDDENGEPEQIGIDLNLDGEPDVIRSA